MAAPDGLGLMLQARQDFVRGTTSVLTCSGRWGGIWITLALSRPEVAAKPPLLAAATYAPVRRTV